MTASPLAKARSFGLSVGTLLVVLGLVLAWRGRTGRAELAGAIGLALVVLGYLRPVSLRHLSAAWWAFAGVLGWIDARVLLSLLFFLVLTPLGLVWRLVGRDSMSRHQSRCPGWTAYPSRYRDDKHFDRMF